MIDGPAPGVWKLTFLPSRSLIELISGRTSKCSSEMYISEMKLIALVDVGDLLDRLEVLEHVGMGDGDVDALEVEQVLDVVGGTRRDDGQHAQVLAGR